MLIVQRGWVNTLTNPHTHTHTHIYIYIYSSVWWGDKNNMAYI